MKVLVTGGSGFLGKNLRLSRPEWDYVSSSEYNLVSLSECDRMIEEKKPDAILHLAAKVGGIKDNSEKQAEYFYKNVTMNTNLVHSAHTHGIKRMLCSLSTCAFPDVLEKYPFKEEDIFSGPPAETNFSYGYSKRLLHVQCVAYRNQYGLNYSTFCPSNLYGPGDHFNKEDSHFVAALITKLFSKEKNLEFWGTGRPMRQFLYVEDLVKIIPILLEKHNSNSPIIVAPKENFHIHEMIEIAMKQLGKHIGEKKYFFNRKLDGQYRKDGSNKRLLDLLGHFDFTPFEEGIVKTAMSYPVVNQLSS